MFKDCYMMDYYIRQLYIKHKKINKEKKDFTLNNNNITIDTRGMKREINMSPAWKNRPKKVTNDNGLAKTQSTSNGLK